MSSRTKLPLTTIKMESEEKLRNRIHIKAIERKIEDQLLLSGKQEWDFNQFVHSVLETLIVMRARDRRKNRK